MSASSLSTDLHRIAEVQVRLPSPIVVVIALFAIGAAVLPDLWLVTRHVTVMAHESAHAVMGSALGRTVTGITMTRQGQGLTRVAGGSTVGNIPFWLAGYFGPSGFGIGAAELIRIGHVIAVLWLSLIGLLILMIPLRKSFGVLTVVGAFVLLIGFIRYATVGTQVVGGYGLTWFMLISGVRQVAEHGVRAFDAGLLRGATRIPHGFWSGFWLLGSLVALGFGASMLV
jgi:Peptidase M50B-like